MTATRKSHWSRKLLLLDACGEAVEWAKTQKTFAAAWKNCTRGDWLCWLIEHIGSDDDRAKLRQLAFQFADRAVRIHAPLALESAGIPAEAARLHALPEIVDEKTADVAAAAARAAATAAARVAARAAAAAAWAAADAAVDAARAAARAAVWAAAAAAWAAAWAAADAARAAADATWDAGRDAESRLQADLIRAAIKAPKLGAKR